jgi:hypothetical protein
MSALAIEKPETVKIQEYSRTAAALADLRGRYDGAIFDVATTSGLKEAKDARAEIKGYRVDLEKTRKLIKAPALERCQLIDDEAKRITAALVELEDPIDAQIKAEEKRKEDERIAREKAEQARVEAIQNRILAMRNAPAMLAGRASAEIRAFLEGKLRPAEISTEKYAEFIDTAEMAKADSVRLLERMLVDSEAHEAEQSRIQAEREELAKLRAEADARKAEEERQAKEKHEREQAELRAEKARIKAEREAHEAKMHAEQDAHDARLRAEREAADRLEADKRREREAEERRLAEERAAIERQRKAAEEAEARAQAEREQAAREKAERDAQEAAQERLQTKIDDIRAAYQSGEIDIHEALYRAYQLGKTESQS